VFDNLYYQGDAMKMIEVKQKAKMLGIMSGKLQKSDLIKFIQLHEGNDICFGSDNKQCSHMECCWRSDCLTIQLIDKPRVQNTVYSS